MTKFVKSIRGKNKLIDDDNHVYVASKRTKDKQFLIWVSQQCSKCKGRVWTAGYEGPMVKVVQEHNHAAQAARPEALQIVQDIKNAATTSNERPHQIVTTTVNEVHGNVVVLLPRKDSIKRTIRMFRNNNNVPALPNHVGDLIIPDNYKKIIIDSIAQPFLMYDSQQELLPGRMLIFSTRSNLDLLVRSQEWFSDGTFSTSPRLFQQLYTIHVIQYNTVVTSGLCAFTQQIASHIY